MMRMKTIDVQRRVRESLVYLRHRRLRAADGILASYPKSGNTWLKFVLIDAITGRSADFDSAEGLIPMVGGSSSLPETVGAGIYKSHEPFRSYMGDVASCLYLVRDGRDVAVSYYYHWLRRGKSWQTFSDYLREFLAGTLDNYGAWHEHVASWSRASRQRDSVVLVRYEDLLERGPQAIGCLRAWAGLSDLTLENSFQRNSVDRMRAAERESAHLKSESRVDIPFVRAGRSGQWRDHFSDSDEELFHEVAGKALADLGYAHGTETTETEGS
jgi:hypothetical protein